MLHYIRPICVVFGKYNTKEKIVIVANNYLLPHIQTHLNKKYGGEWLKIDTLELGEFIKIEDSITYQGFDMEKERYINVETIIKQ